MVILAPSSVIVKIEMFTLWCVYVEKILTASQSSCRGICFTHQDDTMSYGQIKAIFNIIVQGITITKKGDNAEGLPVAETDEELKKNKTKIKGQSLISSHFMGNSFYFSASQ